MSEVSELKGKVSKLIQDVENRLELAENLTVSDTDVKSNLNGIKAVLQSLLNEVLTLESVKGLKALISGRKKKIARLTVSLDKICEELTKTDKLLLNAIREKLLHLTDQRVKLASEIGKFKKVLEERGSVWESVENALFALQDLDEIFKNTKNGLDRVETMDSYNAGAMFSEIWGNIKKIKDELEREHNFSRELSDKIEVRNNLSNVLLKLLSEAEKLRVLENKYFKRDFFKFLEEFGNNIYDESKSEDYLQKALNLLETMLKADLNLVKIVKTLSSVGLDPQTIIRNQDVSEANKLLNLLIAKSSLEYKDYIEREYSFTKFLVEIVEEIAEAITNIRNVLFSTKEITDLFKAFTFEIIHNWVEECRNHGSWEGIKRKLVALGSFLVKAYSETRKCIRVRLDTINKTALRGTSMVMDCIPTKYSKDKFLIKEFLPVLMYEEGADLIRNSLMAYGGRGWIKKSELNSIPKAFFKVYILYHPQVTQIETSGLTLIVDKEILKNRLSGDVSYDTIYSYFSKYITDKKICEEIADQLYEFYSLEEVSDTGG
ncbi:MAG: hypothetical protein ACTSSJ_01150 [Candidatus Odinarchaeia archaeon]